MTRSYGGPGGVPVSCERISLWHLQQNVGGAVWGGGGIYADTFSEFPTRSEFPKLPRPYIHKNPFCEGMVQAARLGPLQGYRGTSFMRKSPPPKTALGP